MQRVHQVGVEELPDGGRPAAEPDILAAGRLARLLQDVGGSPPTKWNVVSERVNDGRSWWVMTNTGVWNGGSSPHQPFHSWSCHGPRWGLNLLRPMISAPMLLAKSRVK